MNLLPDTKHKIESTDKVLIKVIANNTNTTLKKRVSSGISNIEAEKQIVIPVNSNKFPIGKKIVIIRKIQQKPSLNQQQVKKCDTKPSIATHTNKLSIAATPIATFASTTTSAAVAQAVVCRPLVATKFEIVDTACNTTIKKPTNPVGNFTLVDNTKQADPLHERYRIILENLLKLKNARITKTVTEAANQKNSVETSEDLLDVIFRSFELILRSVEIDQVYLNETYLNATLAFLAKVIETGRYMELIENKRETTEIGKYMTPEMTSTLNKVSLESVYKCARDIFREQRRGSYANILELLIKALSCATATPDTPLNVDEVRFWYKDVIPLMFDGDVDIQVNAIEAVEKAIPFLLHSKHQAHPHWPQLRADILGRYTKEINLLFLRNNPKWHSIWCHFVRILDVDIPRSATTLNAFLCIVEPALRSFIPNRRAEGYLCWRVLLEVLVRHNRLNSEKRLKLVCTPLKSLQAKTVEIAINKFHAWWYVLCNVQDNLDGYIEMVFEPFLQFCFGPLAPQPDIKTAIVDTAAQVKSFPDVSLMAVATLVRVMGESDKQIEEIFQKFSLSDAEHPILTDQVFGRSATASLIINACGEATLMLNNLSDDTSNKVDCISLCMRLWSNLLKHVNTSRNLQHVDLILENVRQLLRTSRSDPSRVKTTAILCASILNDVSLSIAFDRTNFDRIPTEVTQTTLNFLNVLLRLPNMQSRFQELLTKPLALPTDIVQFKHNFQGFVTELYVRFFANKDCIEEDDLPTEVLLHNKFTIWTKLIACISSWMRHNSDKIKEFDTSEKNLFTNVFCHCAYWPLTIALDKNEFDVYSKTLLRLTDLVLNFISKCEFCKQSAKTINTIVQMHKEHCAYINDIVSMLFEYMVYDFTDTKGAPVEMLELCTNLVDNEKKIVFQDLNPIATAIIKYRRTISTKQINIMQSKLCDVMAIIEKTKSNLRVDPKLIDDFYELIDDGRSKSRSNTTANGPSKTPKAKQCQSTESVSNSTPHSTTKKATDSEFVVVKKVWKMQPSKLTEHQVEKMKERRCDIPALYNNMSQSQDSRSLQEWTPKSLPPLKDDAKNAADAVSLISVTIDVSKAVNTKLLDSKAPDESKTDSKTNDQQNHLQENGVKKTPLKKTTRSTDDNEKNCEATSKSATKKTRYTGDVERKIDCMNVTIGNNEVKRRLARELNRIHIDAVVEDVPYGHLSESNRLTRSTIKTIEVSSRRKTRSENSKSDLGGNKCLPVPSKSKVNKLHSIAKSSNSNSDSEQQQSEPTPRRTRNTRQSSTTTVALKSYEAQTDVPKILLMETEDNSKVEPLEAQEVPKTTEMAESAIVDIQNNKTEPENIRNNAELTSQETSIDTEPDNASEVIEFKKAVDEVVVDAPLVLPIITDSAADLENQTTETKSDQNPGILEEVERNDGLAIESALSPISERSLLSISSTDDVITNDKSKMSTLVFNELTISPEKPTTNESILTSPKIDAQRNLEFLNDTLNISPIVSDVETVSMHEPNNGKPANESEKIDEVKDTNADVATVPIPEEARPVEKSVPIVKQNERVVPTANANTIDSAVALNSTNVESPVCGTSAMPSKQYKTALSMQTSTPVQSHSQSPVSSKFKTQLVGRGAQLLKMITINKITKTSPVISASTIEVLPGVNTAAPSPTINQLQTAPIFSDNINTPEQQSQKSDFLTFSSVLPSPYESPGVSILKRKMLNDTDDDLSFTSPANKRKRVSFNFPLSQTREFLVEDEITPVYMMPTHFQSSPHRDGTSGNMSLPANRLKMKLKRKNRSDSVKDIAKYAESDSKSSKLSKVILAVNTIANDAEDEVSVEHIKEYLEIENNSRRVQLQEKEIAAADEAAADEPMETNSDDTSPSEIAPDPVTISSFSDDEIFSHLLRKYSAQDVLERFESSIGAQSVRFLTKKLSTIMSNDESIKTSVLDELAEQHSTAFLDHAITENLCSVICDRLTTTSSNGIVDYVAEKINNDSSFSTALLNRVAPTILRKHIIGNAGDTNMQQALLDDLLAVVERQAQQGDTKNTKPLPEHMQKWLPSIFSKFDFTSEQFEELTKLYILRKVKN